MALSDKRKYPVQQFRQFWEVGRRYAELTRRDPLIHQSVVNAVNGVTDFVMAERKRMPEQVVRDVSGWSRWSSTGTIHISRGANRRACRLTLADSPLNT